MTSSFTRPLARRLVAVCAALALFGLPASAGAVENGLARTPYMGWNSYYAFSGNFNEAAVTSTADAMLARGFKAAGYRYVWLDAGWRTHERDKRGAIRVDDRHGVPVEIEEACEEGAHAPAPDDDDVHDGSS